MKNKKEDINYFDLTMRNSDNEIIHLIFENREWKGTAGTNGTETAKLAINFLKSYL